MALSLKAFITELADLLGIKPAALYERQRALVRAGLLKSQSGKGPGSGVRVTAESVAMLITSVLATENLSQTVQQTKRIARAVSQPEALCSVTGCDTFIDTLTAIFASTDTAHKLKKVLVARSRGIVLIFWKHRVRMSVYVSPDRLDKLGDYLPILPAIEVEATIADRTIALIASKILKAISEETAPRKEPT